MCLPLGPSVEVILACMTSFWCDAGNTHFKGQSGIAKSFFKETHAKQFF